MTFTTGRSAEPVPFFYSAHDIQNVHETGHRLVDVMGLRSECRVASVFPNTPHLASWQVFFAEAKRSEVKQWHIELRKKDGDPMGSVATELCSGDQRSGGAPNRPCKLSNVMGLQGRWGRSTERGCARLLAASNDVLGARARR